MGDDDTRAPTLARFCCLTPCLLMGNDMTAFALMTADKSVIATSPSYVNFVRITSPTAALVRWL